MNQPDGLLAAYQLDTQEAVPPDAIQEANRAARPTWLHFDRTRPGTGPWLRTHGDLDTPILQALLADATRPRLTRHGNGILLMLRGSNGAPGAEPDDLMSLRIWAESERVVSLQGHTLEAAKPVLNDLARGAGPRSTGGLLVALIEKLVRSLIPLVEDVEQQTEALEDRVLDPDQTASRFELIELRQRSITLHRFLAPQAIALRQLAGDALDMFDETQRQQLTEAANRVTRLVEEVDATRQRAAVVQDELANQLAEQANQRIYLLTVITAMFLPLTLVSGLFGMNVGGVPLADNRFGFIITNGILLVVAVGSLVIARRRGWI